TPKTWFHFASHSLRSEVNSLLSGIQILVEASAPSGMGAFFMTENPPPFLTHAAWPSSDNAQFMNRRAAFGFLLSLTTPATDAVTGTPSVGYTTLIGAPSRTMGMTEFDCTPPSSASPRTMPLAAGAPLG